MTWCLKDDEMDEFRSTDDEIEAVLRQTLR